MSSFVVPDSHIDHLLTAALAWAKFDRNESFRWYKHVDEPQEGESERGAPWGPDALTAVLTRRLELTAANASNVGRMLLFENKRSCAYRYDEPLELPDYTYHRRDLQSALVILKALSCYEYQSCEHPGWEKSDAHAFVVALRKRAIDALPGYADAKGWALYQ